MKNAPEKRISLFCVPSFLQVYAPPDHGFMGSVLFLRMVAARCLHIRSGNTLFQAVVAHITSSPRTPALQRALNPSFAEGHSRLSANLASATFMRIEPLTGWPYSTEWSVRGRKAGPTPLRRELSRDALIPVDFP